MADLRDYQNECIAAIRADWAEVRSTLAVLATGTGKTIVFLSLLAQLLEAGELTRALIVAHQRKLIQQPVERARQFFPALAREMGVVMGEENNARAKVVVATAQTLARPGRAERLIEHGAFSHVIVDEAHHYTAEVFKSVLANFGIAKIAGFTATPLRTDGDGLAKIFERCSFRFPIGTAIRRGALVPFDALGVALPISFDGLKQTADGWEREPMGDLLRAANVLEIVVDHWQRYAGNRQTIAFTATVAQARDTAEYFKAQGVRAAYVCGETPKDEQDRIARDFESGALQFVANCMIWTEGADFPTTSAVLMIAPTKSDLIYVQRLGRGLRTAPGKENCVVLDFAPLEARNVIMAGDVLGEARDVKKSKEQAAKQGVLIAFSVNRQGEAANIDPSRLVVKVLNLLRKDALAWTVDDYCATASLSEKETLTIVLPNSDRVAKAESLKRSGQWDPRYADAATFLSQFRLYRLNGSARLVGAFGSMDEAKGRADDIALEAKAPEHVLAAKKARWRNDPATDKQENILRSLGVQPPEGCTKGQAAQLITHHMTLRAVRSRDNQYVNSIFRGQGVNA